MYVKNSHEFISLVPISAYYYGYQRRVYLSPLCEAIKFIILFGLVVIRLEYHVN